MAVTDERAQLLADWGETLALSSQACADVCLPKLQYWPANSRSLLRFLDEQVVAPVGRIDGKLLPSVRNAMRDLLLNFTIDESKYKEKLGELLATNVLIAATVTRTATTPVSRGAR